MFYVTTTMKCGPATDPPAAIPPGIAEWVER
jgi:hypothetical protein